MAEIPAPAGPMSFIPGDIAGPEPLHPHDDGRDQVPFRHLSTFRCDGREIGSEKDTRKRGRATGTRADAEPLGPLWIWRFSRFAKAH